MGRAQMKYITHTRFKGRALCGDVNLPAMTECDTYGDYIIHGNKAICLATSENAHQHFARNDDGCGMERGRLTKAIQRVLARRDEQYQARWDKVWADAVCRKYRRKDYDDYWLWSHEFFGAEIEDLLHIADIIKGKDVA